jgi:hypothetical protein
MIQYLWDYSKVEMEDLKVWNCNKVPPPSPNGEGDGG